MLLFMIMSLSPAIAQVLTGQIIDVQSGEAIPFASAEYKGHVVGVASDIDGH